MKTAAASIFNSNNLTDAIQNEEILWNTIQAAAEKEKELTWQMVAGRIRLELLTVSPNNICASVYVTCVEEN
jgi:hypothetical protein